LFNARAWRLIQEQTGFNYLAEQRTAADAANADAKGKESATKYGELIGEKLKGLLTDSLTVPRVLWAITQNPANGKNGERPTLDYVEDYLLLDGTAITKISDALTASFRSGIGGEPQGNVVAEPTPSTGSISGPSEPVDLA
jgi:hypothetical protein